MESLLLSCGALSSPTMCRFIPALPVHETPCSRPLGERPHQQLYREFRLEDQLTPEEELPLAAASAERGIADGDR
jgi:hypothetical protein